MDSAAYVVALKGATFYGLKEAVTAILQGALGHTFFPSPVELRQQCDKAMSWHDRERKRIAAREENARENAEFERAQAAKTPEAKARVKALMESFYQTMGFSEDENDPAVFRRRMEEKYGAEALAHVPDNPDFAKRMGQHRSE